MVLQRELDFDPFFARAQRRRLPQQQRRRLVAVVEREGERESRSHEARKLLDPTIERRNGGRRRIEPERCGARRNTRRWRRRERLGDERSGLLGGGSIVARGFGDREAAG